MSDFSDRLIRDAFNALVAADAARAVAYASMCTARVAYENYEDAEVIDAAMVQADHDRGVSDAATAKVNTLSDALAAHERRALLGAAEGR